MWHPDNAGSICVLPIRPKRCAHHWQPDCSMPALRAGSSTAIFWGTTTALRAYSPRGPSNTNSTGSHTRAVMIRTGRAGRSSVVPASPRSFRYTRFPEPIPISWPSWSNGIWHCPIPIDHIPAPMAPTAVVLSAAKDHLAAASLAPKPDTRTETVPQDRNERDASLHSAWQKANTKPVTSLDKDATGFHFDPGPRTPDPGPRPNPTSSAARSAPRHPRPGCDRSWLAPRWGSSPATRS